jgi:hypothetical protein
MKSTSRLDTGDGPSSLVQTQRPQIKIYKTAIFARKIRGF